MPFEQIEHGRSVTPKRVHADRTIRFSILTLVNDADLYRGMIASFRAGGFALPDCEFLYIDNRGSEQTSAYAGLNRLMQEARGETFILCHQDVRLLGETRKDLEQRLAELGDREPRWAVAGNAGGKSPGVLAIRISDGHGANVKLGELPEFVGSLDENFLIVRPSAGLAFSADLEGFHFYGTDICLVADTLGHTAHVIDFHLEHLSKGNIRSQGFKTAEQAFRAKWSRALRPRWVQTTCSLLYLSGQPLVHAVFNAGRRVAAAVARRLPRAQGLQAPQRSGNRT